MLSIIIPFRETAAVDRWRPLEICLWSICRSVSHAELADWEVCIADDSAEPRIPKFAPSRLRYIHVPPLRDKPWNKPRILNLAMGIATGDVLMFIDADAILGRDTVLDTLWAFKDEDLVKVCYRVRQIHDGDPPRNCRTQVLTSTNLEATVSEMFRFYHEHHLAYESYGEAYDGHRKGPKRTTGMPFGNSQFAIRRQDMIPYNEDFEGGGFEDLWMSRELGRIFRHAYKSVILTEPESGLLVIAQKEYEKDWRSGAFAAKGEKRYERT